MPRDESVSFERRPIISRNQGAQAPLRHALITRPVPKALMVAQAKPAAPWFPKTKVSAAAGPTSVVNIANSTNPLPKLGTWRLRLNADVVEFVDSVVMDPGFDNRGWCLMSCG